MALKKKTITLLRSIQQRIIKNPNQFNMATFGELTEQLNIDSYGVLPNACGTQACIAGEILLQAKKAKISPAVGELRLTREFSKKFGDDRGNAAAHVAGLTNKQRDRLFYTDRTWTGSWPEKFKDAYNNAGNYLLRAAVAVARIEHFIATGGNE